MAHPQSDDAAAMTSTMVWTLLAASFSFALVQLDVTIVNVALPRIGEELKTDVSSLQWVVDSYALVFAVLLLSAGFLSDRFGARKVFLGGLAVLAIASIACGFASTITLLILARGVQGVGAAAMLPASLALLNHSYAHAPKLRAKAVGWWTAAGSITIAAGPIVGGLLLGLGSWRSIFLVNVPVCLLGAALTLRVPETEPHGSSRSFDMLGQILSIVALTSLVGTVIEVHRLGWANPFVLGGFGLAVAAGIGFVRAEARVRSPMVPLSLFANRAFNVAILYGVIANLTYYGVVFVLSLYLQRVLGYTAVQTGLAYLPLTATFFVVNLLSGWAVGHIGARMPMILGALVDACGFALLLPLTAHSPYLLLFPAFALMPGGMGFGVPAMTTVVLGAVDKRLSGVASAVLNAARQAAGAIGVAISGALAGDDVAQITPGLHRYAMLAVGLLLVASALSAWGIAPTRLQPVRRLDPDLAPSGGKADV